MSESSTKQTKSSTKPPATPMDHLRSMKKPVIRTVRICMDSEIAEQVAQAEIELQYATIDAERNPSEDADKRIQEINKRLDGLREDATKRSMKFVFRSIGRRKYEEVLYDNLATEEQKQAAIERGDDPDELDWNPDTFPPAMVHACLLEPELSLEDVQEIFESDDWSSAELMLLYQTAQEAQTFSSVLNLGKD